MGVAALIAWLVTGGLGFALVAIWLGRRAAGRRQARAVRFVVSRPPPYIPAQLVVGHSFLALSGLFVWCLYLARDASLLAWVALAMILPVALGGSSMFIRWIGSRRLRRVARGSIMGRPPTESLLPILIVYAHGTAGLVTVSLVLLTALGIGGT